MSKTNNNKNTLVNFSHVILKYIVSHIDDNLDRISFSLVCRKFFNDRNKYLIFNFNTIIKDTNNSYSKYNFYKSFINQYKCSIDNKYDISLCINYYRGDNDKVDSDYYYNYGKNVEFNINEKCTDLNIKKVILSGAESVNSFKRLYNKLKLFNIEEIDVHGSLLCLYDQLNISAFQPSHIKTLKIYNNEIITKFTHFQSLKHLEYSNMKNYSSQEFNSSQHVLRQQPPITLPSTLQSFLYHSNVYSFSVKLLPLCLTSLDVNMFLTDIKELKYFQSLRVLKFHLNQSNIQELEPNDLPITLKKLSIKLEKVNLGSIQPGVIPFSLKKLTLDLTNYESGNLCLYPILCKPSTTFTLIKKIQIIGPLPSTTFPEGLKSIDLKNSTIEQDIKLNQLPSTSLKSFSLPKYDKNSNHIKYLPLSLITLDINNNEFDFSIIHPTIRYLKIRDTIPTIVKIPNHVVYIKYIKAEFNYKLIRYDSNHFLMLKSRYSNTRFVGGIITWDIFKQFIMKKIAY